METMFKIGDKVLIELNGCQVYEGNVHTVSQQKIELYQVVQYSQNNKLNGLLLFYKNDITNIKKIYFKDSNCFKELMVHLNNLDTSKVTYKFKNTIVLSYEEYSKVQLLKTNVMYIDRPDARYFKAINDFKKAERIAIAPIGVEDQRVNRSLKLLVISTLSQVYIFEFRNRTRTEFPVELRELLENPCIKKIMYNGAYFEDFLLHIYNFQITRVFDINLFDKSIIQLKNGKNDWRTLEKCLESYLNLVPTVVRTEGEINRFSWSQMSLPMLYKIHLAELVIYLFSMERVLCKEYNRLTKEVLSI